MYPIRIGVTLAAVVLWIPLSLVVICMMPPEVRNPPTIYAVTLVGGIVFLILGQIVDRRRQRRAIREYLSQREGV